LQRRNPPAPEKQPVGETKTSAEIGREQTPLMIFLGKDNPIYRIR